jgi:glyoxylase-like metal-dependent hydrolase (beta-lactamase superfamily II)
MLPRVEEYDHGISCIDTEQVRPGLACCYLIRAGTGTAGAGTGSGECYGLVECGTALSVPGLLRVLETKGIARDQVAYVMPTHVHLDHAGGAGVLMRALPNAKLVVHPRGARHMIDPSKLIEGASAVYGAENLPKMYGDIAPIPESRVIVAEVEREGGFRLDFNGRELLFLDAPGHARHHYAIWDAASRGIFTGDVFGLSYREFDGPEGPYLLPTTTPVQFEPEAWAQTLDRLMALGPEWIYLTHYGRLGEVPRLERQLRSGLATYQRIALQCADLPDRHERLVEALLTLCVDEARALNSPVPAQDTRRLLQFDCELSAQGLEVWLDKHGKR